ncbi:MAG: hypothetical protein RBR87_07085 [Bacteroidales bacterium]|jgi:hypothetical protein|nr:hypothetical protein [Bacteroidales bacterium]
MKKYLSFLLASFFMIALLSFSSCSKDKEDNATPSYELRFTNTSNNPYLVEVDGNSNILSGNTFKNYTLKKGTYAWKITQQSGYILYPTVKDGTVNLSQDKEIVFP